MYNYYFGGNHDDDVENPMGGGGWFGDVKVKGKNAFDAMRKRVNANKKPAPVPMRNAFADNERLFNAIPRGNDMPVDRVASKVVPPKRNVRASPAIVQKGVISKVPSVCIKTGNKEYRYYTAKLRTDYKQFNKGKNVMPAIYIGDASNPIIQSIVNPRMRPQRLHPKFGDMSDTNTDRDYSDVLLQSLTREAKDNQVKVLLMKAFFADHQSDILKHIFKAGKKSIVKNGDKYFLMHKDMASANNTAKIFLEVGKMFCNFLVTFRQRMHLNDQDHLKNDMEQVSNLFTANHNKVIENMTIFQYMFRNGKDVVVNMYGHPNGNVDVNMNNIGYEEMTFEKAKKNFHMSKDLYELLDMYKSDMSFMGTLQMMLRMLDVDPLKYNLKSVKIVQGEATPKAKPKLTVKKMMVPAYVTPFVRRSM